MDVKKGDYVQFRCDQGSQLTMKQLRRIVRIARDQSWADVQTQWGGKRIPHPYENLRVVQAKEWIGVYI